jgi:hypothetical protein
MKVGNGFFPLRILVASWNLKAPPGTVIGAILLADAKRQALSNLSRGFRPFLIYFFAEGNNLRTS